MAGKEYILKILSGPHLGAEVILNQGRYTLGQDEKCEIILNGMDIAQQHLTLLVGDGCLDLTALGGSFLVDGQRKDETDARVDFFQVVTMGTTRFAVGPGDEKWPRLNLPDAVLPATTNLPSDPSVQEAPQPKKNRPGRRSKRLLAAGCICLTVIAVSMALMFKSNAISGIGNETGPADNLNLEKANRVITETRLLDIRAILKDHDRIVITGYVENPAQKKDLMDALSGQNLNAEVKVRVNKAIVEACREVIRAAGFSFEVASQGPGAIVFSGSASDRQDWEKAKTMLEQDIPGILSMAFRVMEPALPVEIVQKTDIREKPGHLETPANGGTGFRLALRSMNLGRIRYLTWSNGQKYFEGSELENGYVIKSIQPDRIIVAYRNREETYFWESSNE